MRQRIRAFAALTIRVAQKTTSTNGVGSLVTPRFGDLMRTWVIPGTAAALTLAGCKVGPNYHPPRVDMPAGWVSPTAAQSTASTQPSVAVVQPTPEIARWWATFNDPALESLVRRALESNYALRIAASRVREARLARRVAASGLYPAV